MCRDFSNWKVVLPPLSSKIIEIPDESEKSPVLEKKEEVDSAAAKEDKEKEAENGDGSKEKETEDGNKDKEEDKTSEMEKDNTAEGEGSDGKNNEGEASVKTFISVLFSFIFCHTNSTSLVSVEGGKDEKMDVSSLTEDKKGAHMSANTHFEMNVWRQIKDIAKCVKCKYMQIFHWHVFCYIFKINRGERHCENRRFWQTAEWGKHQRRSNSCAGG